VYTMKGLPSTPIDKPSVNDSLYTLANQASSSKVLPDPGFHSRRAFADSAVSMIKDVGAIDLAGSPKKSVPPWKNNEVISTSSSTSADVVVTGWFSESSAAQDLMNPTVQTMKHMESLISQRFRRSLPMSPQLIEFLSHTSSTGQLDSKLHPESILSTRYATCVFHSSGFRISFFPKNC
jgi:hypothetical protein